MYISAYSNRQVPTSKSIRPCEVVVGSILWAWQHQIQMYGLLLHLISEPSTGSATRRYFSIRSALDSLDKSIINISTHAKFRAKADRGLVHSLRHGTESDRRIIGSDPWKMSFSQTPPRAPPLPMRDGVIAGLDSVILPAPRWSCLDSHYG